MGALFSCRTFVVEWFYEKKVAIFIEGPQRYFKTYFKTFDSHFLEAYNENMLDDKDIQKLIEVFATREEIVTKPMFEELKSSFNDLQTSVDAYAEKADTYFQEMAMLTLKVNRHEKWLEKMAEKLGMKLDYY